MSQALLSPLFLYADKSGLPFKEKHSCEIEKREEKPQLRDWFVENELSIHFEENSTKSILYAPKDTRS